MFSFYKKIDLFNYLENNKISKIYKNFNNIHLKTYQDIFVVYQINNKNLNRVAEIGGGNSRVLNYLDTISKNKKLYNIEPLLKNTGGPKQIEENKNINIISETVGEYKLANYYNFFDIIFSISVIEHIPFPDLNSFLDEQYKLLKPGGTAIHCVDFYLPTDKNKFDLNDQNKRRYEMYFSHFSDFKKYKYHDLVKENLIFDTCYVSNPDHIMQDWNKSAPSLREARELSQSCSLNIIASKNA